jgi:hypothetical protein
LLTECERYVRLGLLRRVEVDLLVKLNADGPPKVCPFCNTHKRITPTDIRCCCGANLEHSLLANEIVIYGAI